MIAVMYEYDPATGEYSPAACELETQRSVQTTGTFPELTKRTPKKGGRKK